LSHSNNWKIKKL